MTEKKQEKTATVKFEFDFENIYQELTVEEWIGIERVIPHICLGFFSKHVSDGEGGVLPPELGFVQVQKLKIVELQEVAEKFFERLRKVAINPTSGKRS